MGDSGQKRLSIGNAAGMPDSVRSGIGAVSVNGKRQRRSRDGVETEYLVGHFPPSAGSARYIAM